LPACWPTETEPRGTEPREENSALAARAFDRDDANRCRENESAAIPLVGSRSAYSRAVTDAPSPNHEPRAAGVPLDTVVLHYTGMPTGAEAIARLRDPAATVSAHYLIETGGRVLRLVPEHRRAWHAGAACWAGETDINSRSIGIELVNRGHAWGYHPFPDSQLESLRGLLAEVMQRHTIPPERVLGHSDVAPARKIDPGELLPWRWLADQGLAVWPVPVESPVETPGLAWFQDGLAAVGYCVPRSHTLDDATANVLTAFQRRFRPAAVTGAPDTETAARLRGLLARDSCRKPGDRR